MLIKSALKTATIEQMTKIPLEEKDLIDVPIYISMNRIVPVESTITKMEIKSSVLRMIYYG